MKIKISDLTEENLIEVPEWEGHPHSCKYCLYWEHPELSVDPAQEKKEEVFEKKRTWIHQVRTEFGECGKLLYLGGRAVGYAQFAPAEFLPNTKNYPAGPVSQDAVFIACLFIPRKEHRRHGLGSLLLQSIVHDLRFRGLKAVEALARKGSPENPSGPVEFYLRHGFHVLRDDAEFPLMRLEL